MAHGVPDEEVSQPQVSPENLPRKLVPRAPESSLGAGIASFGDSLNRKYDSDSATWAADQIAQRRLEALQQYSAMQSQSQPGQTDGFTGKFLAQYTKDNGPLLEQAGNNKIARDMLQKGLTDTGRTLALESTRWEAEQNVAYTTNSIQSNVLSQLPLIRAHPQMADQVGSTASDQIRASSIAPDNKQKMLDWMDGQVTHNAALGLTDSNPGEVYRQLKSGSPTDEMLKRLTDPRARADVLAQASAQVAKTEGNSVVDTYRNQGPVAGGKAFAAIDKLDFPDDIKRGIYANAETGLSQYHKEARDTNSPQILALEEHLASGKVTQGDINSTWDLYHKGAFEGAQAGETIGRIEKAQMKDVDDGAWAKYIGDAYQNGRALDPKNKDIQSGIADLFTAHTQGVSAGSNEWINRGADIAEKTGVTPEPVISWARTQLVSGDPATAALAARAIQRQQDANPRGLGFAMDPETKAMAKITNESVLAGTDPAVAVEHARQIAAMSDAQKLRLEELYKKQKIAEGAPGALYQQLQADKDLKTGVFEHKTAIPPDMVGQFEELRQQYFKLTNGDVTKTNELAGDDLKHTWGITEVNGVKQYMEYAPEAKNPGLSTEYLRADMEKSASEAMARSQPDYDYIKKFSPEVAGQFAQAPGTPGASRVTLVPTAQTYQSEGQRWALGIPDKYGLPEVIRNARGQPMIYTLPTATDSIIAAQAKDSAAGMLKLRQDIAGRRQAESELWNTVDEEASRHEWGK